MKHNSPFSRFTSKYTKIDPGTTPFDIMDIQTQERRLTRILGWLLDTEGTHGADREFLDAFGQAVGISSLRNASFVTVKCFDPQTEGQQRGEIDLVLFTETTCIGVEIKTGDDTETTSKLQKEIDNLQQKFGPYYDFQFVYLTPHYHDSADLSASIPVHTVSWTEVIAEFEAIEVSRLNEDVERILEQFTETIRRFNTNSRRLLSPESEQYLHIYGDLKEVRQGLEDARRQLIGVIETRLKQQLSGKWLRDREIGQRDYIHVYKNNWRLDPEEPPIQFAFSLHLQPNLGPSAKPTVGIYLDFRGQYRDALIDTFEEVVDSATLSSLYNDGYRTAPFGLNPDLHYLGTVVPLPDNQPVNTLFDQFQPLADLEPVLDETASRVAEQYDIEPAASGLDVVVNQLNLVAGSFDGLPDSATDYFRHADALLRAETAFERDRKQLRENIKREFYEYVDSDDWTDDRRDVFLRFYNQAWQPLRTASGNEVYIEYRIVDELRQEHYVDLGLGLELYVRGDGDVQVAIQQAIRDTVTETLKTRLEDHDCYISSADNDCLIYCDIDIQPRETTIDEITESLTVLTDITSNIETAIAAFPELSSN